MGDHRAQDAKGRMKEAVGRLTNKGDMVRKGQDDRTKAKVKGRAGDVKHKLQESAAEAKHRLSRARGRATDHD
jgi:uncharacterized protein YjbJ (UPF0337 family)